MMTKEEIDLMIARMPQSIRTQQFRVCEQIVRHLRESDVSLSLENVLKVFPNGLNQGSWSASNGRLAAMVLQVGLYGELQPVFAETDPQEYSFRGSREDRKMLMSKGRRQ